MQKKFKLAPGAEQITSMEELRKERVRARKAAPEPFKQMSQVAEYLGIPEEALHAAVLKAFLEMASEEHWLYFPLMFQQVEILDR